jgi:hypothetical protein
LNASSAEFAEHVRDELLTGKYPMCTDLSGLVRQFAERSVVYRAQGAKAELWRGLTNEEDPVLQLDSKPELLPPGQLVDLVSDWNGNVDYKFDKEKQFCFARCLKPEPQLTSEAEVWVKTKAVLNKVAIRARYTDVVGPDHPSASPYWVKLGPLDESKLKLEMGRIVSRAGPPVKELEGALAGFFSTDGGFQSLLVCQSKLVDSEGQSGLQTAIEDGGLFGWPSVTPTWPMFCEVSTSCCIGGIEFDGTLYHQILYHRCFQLHALNLRWCLCAAAALHEILLSGCQIAEDRFAHHCDQRRQTQRYCHGLLVSPETEAGVGSV